MGDEREIVPQNNNNKRDKKNEVVVRAKQNEVIVRAKQIFLEEPAKHIEDKVRRHETYYIEEEFPKLAKNVNYFLRFLLLGFVIVFLTIAFFGTNYFIKSKSKDIEINISDFASINVSEVFGDVNKLKAQATDKKKVLDKLEDDYNSKKEAIEKKKYFDILSLKEKQLAKAEHNKELDRIEKEAAAATGKLNSAYKQIDTLKASIRKLEGDLNASSQKANKATSSMDSFNRLSKLRMDNLKKDYRGKIDDIKNLHSNEIKSLEARYNDLIGQINNKYQGQLDSYKHSVDHYMEKLGHVGIVLSVPNNDSIKIYIHPTYSGSLPEQARGYVIDQNNQIVGEVNITKKYDYYEGKIINRDGDRTRGQVKINPLDNVALVLD